MAIPIRNYPYTDYHDLNLDFLLRQFQQYEIDIEDLKRRVKALEDWRETAEPDINTLKNQMVQVLNDILLLQNRLTSVEGNVLTLSNNNKSYYVDADSNYDVTAIHVGSPTGETLDISSGSVRDSIINRFRNAIQSTGQIVDRVFVNGYGCRVDIVSDGIIFDYDDNIMHSVGHGLYITNVRIKLNDSSNITPTSSTAMIYGVRGIMINAILDSDNWVATSDPDLPYSYTVTVSSVKSASQIDVYFRNLADFKTYSDIVSEYIDVTDGSFTVYASELPLSDIPIKFVVTGGA